MKYYKHILISLFAITVIGTPWIVTRYPKSALFIDNIFSYIGKNYTAVFFQEGITVSQLRDKYEESDRRGQEKIKIMIVPGHEPSFGGAEYGILKERDMSVDLANWLSEFFDDNPHYEVIIARDKNSWNPELQRYFSNNWQEIIDFLKESKNEMLRLVNDGSVSRNPNGIFHNDAPQDVAVRLYGINKWNNENGVDLAIHIHFNDYPRSNTSSPGKYSGLAIYVPERQYSNSTTTRVIADTIFKRLAKYNAVSDLPIESAGVIEEQELIAVGSYNTLDVPSMLIEYGYIYEPQFAEPEIRQSTIKDLAFQTYLGVEDFFDKNRKASYAYDTLLLPYFWQGDISKQGQSREILALQTALIVDGVYPPSQKTKNDCPRTGRFGPCTINALTSFQNKYGITGEAQVVGEQTRRVLNQLYSAQLK